MFGKTDPLGPSSEEIVAKVIDGEAIIINLSNGFYYSTVGSGAVVWAGVEAGRTSQDIIDNMAAQYGQDRTVVERDIDAFLAQLAGEGLIGIATAGARQAPAGVTVADGKTPYEAPALTKFEDMAHFFALDPPLPDLDENSSSPVEP